MLRKIVGSRKLAFSYYLELECGHKVHHDLNRKVPRRKRCPKCEIANKIAKAKKKHPELFENET